MEKFEKETEINKGNKKLTKEKEKKKNENGKKHVKDHFKRRILGKDESQMKNKYNTMTEKCKRSNEIRKTEIKLPN